MTSVGQKDWAEDWARGRWDTAFWSKRFLNVTLHPGQVKFAQAVEDRSDNEWRAKYLTIMLSAGNRAGKTLALAVILLHAAFYKLGTKPPEQANPKDLKRWLTSQYMAFHLGIVQEVADLVFFEIVRLLDGTHVAQNPRGCPLVDETGPAVVKTDTKYQGSYRWVRLSPMFGGAEIHFRTTSEQALSTLGREMNLISFDEAAFDTHLDFVVSQVLHMRRLGTGGQLLLVSTPTDGLTAFADLWAQGDPGNPLRVPDRLSLRMSTRDNVGFGLDKKVFERLVADLPEYLIPQNVDGYFIEGQDNFFNSQSVDACFDDDLPELSPAEPGGYYVQGVDPALTNDSTWSIVLKVDADGKMVGVRGSRIRGRQHTESVLALVIDAHRAYTTGRKKPSTCATAIDATALGGKTFLDLLQQTITPVRNVEFGGTRVKKLKLLGDLKVAMDQGDVKFPRTGLWLQLRRQLLGYKIRDRKIEQDAVMALACAISEAKRAAVGGHDSVPFYPFVPAEQGYEIGFADDRRFRTWTKDDFNDGPDYFEDD